MLYPINIYNNIVQLAIPEYPIARTWDSRYESILNMSLGSVRHHIFCHTFEIKEVRSFRVTPLTFIEIKKGKLPCFIMEKEEMDQLNDEISKTFPSRY